MSRLVSSFVLLVLTVVSTSGSADAARIALLDGDVDLASSRAVVRDVGDFRFAVLPDGEALPSDARVRALDLGSDEELFLVDTHGEEALARVATAARIVFAGDEFALVAATHEQSMQLDRASVCRERVTWIEPAIGAGTIRPHFQKVNPQVKTEILAAVSQPRYSQIVREVSGNIVFWLNGSLESTDNRYTHTAGSGSGIDIAAAYLEDRFTSAGYTVTRQPFDVGATTTDNIIAIKPGTSLANEIIVVGAHYDSISENTALRAPGAEDNGSGTAAVLQLAEIFADYETERTIHFICFSGEEEGLYGSQYYVSQLGANGWNVVNALTMDMISAWESNYKVIIEGQTPWESLMSLFETNVTSYAQIASRKDYFSFGSDHVPFQQAGIPAFLAIDWDYPSYDHYHRTTDTWDHLDPTLGHRITKAMAGTLADLTNPTPSATDTPAMERRFALDQNVPNPFNPRTLLRFEVDRDGPVSLRVYDLAGRHVRTLVDTTLEAGRHIARWDGTDLAGRAVASGSYLVRLSGTDQVATRQLTLVR